MCIGLPIIVYINRLVDSSSREKMSKRDAGSIFVAVMGMTGAGKSNFIYTLTNDDNVKVGHKLESETQEIAQYHLSHKGKNYVLIDTPGFGDTYRSNDDIMTLILDWLAVTYEKGTRLNGIVYLHPISEPRMQGTAYENLSMFRKLCGDCALRNVILATTFWDTVDEATATRREIELASNPEFWGEMSRKGCRIRRLHGKDPSSAFALLEDVDVTSNVTLDAQREMVDEGKKAHETRAAKDAITAERAKMEAELREEEERTRRRVEERQRMAEERARRVRERHLQEIREQEKRQRRERRERERLQKLEEARKTAEHEAFLARMLEEEDSRKAELERLARERRELEERRKREIEEACQRYYKNYVCIGRSVSRYFPCDKCGVGIRRYLYYYHCCHCDNDHYNHCYGCGAYCKNGSEHPSMIFRTVPENKDGCIVM